MLFVPIFRDFSIYLFIYFAFLSLTCVHSRLTTWRSKADAPAQFYFYSENKSLWIPSQGAGVPAVFPPVYPQLCWNRSFAVSSAKIQHEPSRCHDERVWKRSQNRQRGCWLQPSPKSRCISDVTSRGLFYVLRILTDLFLPSVQINTSIPQS